jgi:glycosyltransferase involved in cell wall biosynthesis
MSRRVLILNRRCIYHPQSGGAERYTFELARALIDKGFCPEWFCSRFKGANPEEHSEGIRFIRRGNELTTHLYGLWHLIKYRNKYELIIDEFNGTGFISFWHKRSILLIHQLYREFFTAELGLSGLPLIFLEKSLLNLYSDKPTITVSESTRGDLLNMGFKNVEILSNPAPQPVSEPPRKNEELTLVYLGRLKRTKNPEDAIKAFLIVRNIVPSARMIVMGNGPQRPYLEGKYGKSGIEFKGFVSEEEKREILKRSHFLLVPSIREGWGVVVTEANACGTPAVGYRVHGLKDSIKEGITGVLVNNFRDMAYKVIELWSKKEEYERMVKACIDWARELSSVNFRDRAIEVLRKSAPWLNL